MLQSKVVEQVGQIDLCLSPRVRCYPQLRFLSNHQQKDVTCLIRQAMEMSWCSRVCRAYSNNITFSNRFVSWFLSRSPSEFSGFSNFQWMKENSYVKAYFLTKNNIDKGMRHFPEVDWSRVPRHFLVEKQTKNPWIHYNNHEYMYDMSTVNAANTNVINPLSKLILFLVLVVHWTRSNSNERSLFYSR